MVERTENMFEAWVYIHETGQWEPCPASLAHIITYQTHNGKRYKTKFLCIHKPPNQSHPVIFVKKMSNGARARFEHTSAEDAADCIGGAVDETGKRKKNAGKVL